MTARTIRTDRAIGSARSVIAALLRATDTDALLSEHRDVCDALEQLEAAARSCHAERLVADALDTDESCSVEAVAAVLHSTVGLLGAIEDAVGLDTLLSSDPEAAAAIDEFLGQFG